MRLNLTISAAALALAAGLLGAGAAAAAPAFDGRWSVLIVTEKGDCDRAFRYAVEVQGGQVRLAETGSPVDVTGKVASNGAVRVSLRRGEQRADGTGRLAKSHGAGTWKGKSNSSECAGRWEAERR